MTENYIYCCSLKIMKIVSNLQKFSIQNVIDTKWCSKGLYYLTSSGKVGLIEKQRTFIDEFRNVNMHESGQVLLAHNTFSIANEEYECKNIVVYDDEILIGIFWSKIFVGNILLQVLNDRRHGRTGCESLKFTLKKYRGDILYQNALMCGGYLNLIVCTGDNGRINEINEYVFGI